MRILHVVDQISQETGGGASKVPFELAHAQAQLGHDVTIYSTDYNAHTQVAPDKVKLVKFKCWFNLLGSMRVAPGLLFARYNYDVIHMHNYRTIVNLFVALRCSGFIVQAHGSCYPIKGLSKPIHDAVWGGVILKRAGMCIADADIEVLNYMAEGAKKEHIINIPVGINLKDYKKSKRLEIYQHKTVLFLGRLHWSKGCDLLIDAFQYLPDDIRLIVAGVDYGEGDNLKAQVERLGLTDRVKFIGPVYGADKINAYTNADIYVMPSRNEMWGIVFMESLACGTPVIMTDTCQAAKVLLPECGLSVPFDAKQLAAAIKLMFMLKLPEQYRDYRKKWVAQYSWDNIAKQTIKMYEGMNE